MQSGSRRTVRSSAGLNGNRRPPEMGTKQRLLFQSGPWARCRSKSTRPVPQAACRRRGYPVGIGARPGIYPGKNLPRPRA